jgi:glycine betaine/choline ABC-type transport system substrate-binding protein
MDLSLIDRALAAGELDIVAGAATDGLIPALDLFQLEDDRHYFPPYQAVFIAREDKMDMLAEAFRLLENSITTDDMRRLNYEVDGKQRSPREVAAEWLAGRKLATFP